MNRITIKSKDIIIKNNDKSKPLEDYIINDKTHNIYIVLDGVTRSRNNGKYSIPSPSKIVTKKFGLSVHKMLKIFKNRYLPKQALFMSIKYANEKIGEYNLKHNFDFLPGTVGIISFIKNDTFYYMYLGDCSGRIIRTKKSKLFTHSQTELINKNKNNFTTYEIRNIICNNKKHPFGYGVFNGQKGALEFLQFGHIKLKQNDNILLYSDGFENLLNNNQTIWKEPINIKSLANKANEIDKVNKLKSDDKALISIEVK